MKRILYACFLLNVMMLHAQDITVTTSQQFKLKDFDFRKTSSADKLGDFFYGMKFDKGRPKFGFTVKLDDQKVGIGLIKYDLNMNVVKTVALQNGAKDFGPFPPQIKIFGNRVLLFFYKVQPDKTITLYVTDINQETLDSGTPTELYTFTQKNVGLFNMESAYDSNKLDFCLSPDASQLLVALSGTTNEIFSCVIDNNVAVAGKKTSVQKNNPNQVSINSAYIDKTGNRYFGYTYKQDKELVSGILMVTNSGQEHFVPFTSAMPDSQGGNLFFGGTKDNKVYVYGGYRIGDLHKGIFLTTVDAASFKIAKPVLFAYAPDMMESLHKLDFAEKHKGDLGIVDISYTFTDLDNGAVAITGYPTYVKETYFSRTNISPAETITEGYAGPIIAVVFKGDKGNAVMIPRKLGVSQAYYSGAFSCIYFGWKGNLVCIYCDREKNLQTNDVRDVSFEKKPDELVLAEAVISSDATIISRKKIADKPGDSNYFFTDSPQKLSPSSYLIPVGRIRINMMQAYTELQQWVTLTAQ